MLLAGGGFNGVMGAGLVAEIKADREEKTLMACRSCGSENQTELGAEINIHFPGRKGLDKPAVLVFPKLVVCLDCGFAQFTLPEAELLLLGERVAA
jgi:hypothetical protein